MTEFHRHQHQLLVPALTGDHGILDLAETAGDLAQLGPLALQIGWSQILLQVKRKLAAGHQPAAFGQVFDESKGCGFDGLNLIGLFPGQQFAVIVQHN